MPCSTLLCMFHTQQVQSYSTDPPLESPSLTAQARNPEALFNTPSPFPHFPSNPLPITNYCRFHLFSSMFTCPNCSPPPPATTSQVRATQADQHNEEAEGTALMNLLFSQPRVSGITQTQSFEPLWKALNRSHFLPQMKSITQGTHSITIASWNVGCREGLVPWVSPLEVPMPCDPRGQSQIYDYGNQIPGKANVAPATAPPLTAHGDILWG